MPKRQAGLTFILVTVFLDMLGLGIVFPILPKLIASFLNGDLSAAAPYYGYFIALFAAMQFLFAPILGSLSDQYGRRPVLLLSLFGAGLDYVLLSFAPSLAWLFVGRIVSGMTAASFTVANAYIADVTPPEKRAENFGVIGAAFGLGFILGPVLGGVFGTFGARVPFMVAGILTLLNWMYGFFVLPESLAPELRHKFSLRTANPVASLGALRRYPAVLSLTIMVICTNLAGQFLQSTWVLYTTYRYQWNVWEQGLSLALVGVMAMVVQGALIRVLLPRWGERLSLVIGLACSILAYACYGLASQGWMIYVIMLATGLNFIAQPAAQGLISNAVQANEQGAIQGALTGVISMTAIIGPIAGTFLFAYFTSPSQPVSIPGAPFFAGAILTSIGLILALRLFRQLDKRAVAERQFDDSKVIKSMQHPTKPLQAHSIEPKAD